MAAPLASPSRSVEKRLLAYNALNRFLSAFIDHSLGELNYLVRDKLYLEHGIKKTNHNQIKPYFITTMAVHSTPFFFTVMSGH